MSHHSGSVSLALAPGVTGAICPLLILQPQSHPEASTPEEAAMGEIPIDRCLKQKCF